MKRFALCALCALLVSAAAAGGTKPTWSAPGAASRAKDLSIPCAEFSQLSTTISAGAQVTNGIPGTPFGGETYTVSISGPGTGTFRIVSDPLGSVTFAGPTNVPGTLHYTFTSTDANTFGIGYYFDSGQGTVTVTASCSSKNGSSTDLPAPELQSRTVSGAPTTRDSTHTALSRDGRVEVFESQEPGLVVGNEQATGGQDIYTTLSGATVLENVDAGGRQMIGSASLPAISSDGKVVAFLFGSAGTSPAKDLLLGQMFAGASGGDKHQVNLTPSGGQPNGPAVGAPSVSTSNGVNKLVFCSGASNLVNGDTNGKRDVFLVNPSAAGSPAQRVSTDSSGNQIAGDSCEPQLSADGTKVVFTVSAPGLYGTTARQVVRKDLGTGKLELMSPSRSGSGQGANGDSSEPSVSADGAVVAYTSGASDLDALGAPVGGHEVFLSLAQNGADGAPRLMHRARSGDGTVPNGGSQHPQVTDDGNTVVVQTIATNFLGGKSTADACGSVALSTNFFSPTLMGSSLCGSGTSNQNPSISGDGSTVGFDSNAPQPGTGSNNSNTYSQSTGTNTIGVANLSGDLSGQWYDPSQSGQGLVIDVTQPDSNGNRVLLMTWFVFDAGVPTWLQGVAVPKANSSGAVVAQMDQVAIFTGRSFPLGEATASSAVWGSITLSFANANSGSMAWVSTYPGFNSGQMPLVHFLPVGTPSQDAAGVGVRSCYSGNWFNPAQVGHGFEFSVIPVSPPVLVADWFAFDPSGKPVWLQGAGTISGNAASMQLQLIDGPGAQFPPAFNAGALNKHVWGTATFTFADASHASVTWNSTISGYGSGTQPLQPTLGAGSLDRRGCN